MRFNLSVGFVNVSEEMEARFDTEYTTEQRGITVVYSIRKVQYAIGRLVDNEHISKPLLIGQCLIRNNNARNHLVITGIIVL